MILLLILPATTAVQQGDDLLYARPAPVQRIAADPWLDGVWIGTGMGLFFKDLETGSLRHYGLRDGLPALDVYDIHPRPDRVWLATALGPVVLAKDTGRIDRVTQDGGFLDASGHAILSESDAVWIGTQTAGLFRVDPESLEATPVPNPVDGQPFKHDVRDLVADGSVLFITARQYGIVEWDRATGAAQKHDIHVVYDESRFGRIAVDGNEVWIGTQGEGAAFLDRATGYMTEYAGPSTINARIVHSVLTVGPEVWFATEAGVSRYDREREDWDYWQGLPGGQAFDVALIDGQVHAGLSNGVVRFERSNATWTSAQWWRPEGVPSYSLFTSCTPHGPGILATTGGGGALLLDLEEETWLRYGAEPGATGKPRDILIWSTATDGPVLWFGTHKGISRYDSQANAWRNLRTDGYDPAQPIRLDNPVHDLELAPGALWAASIAGHIPASDPGGERWVGGNVARFDLATETWEYFDSDDGLRDDNVTRLVVDGGTVWAGTAKGLDRLDVESGVATPVFPPEGQVDGVTAMLRDGDTLWVGMANAGLVAVELATGAAETHPAVGETLISLAMHDGRLWGGTPGHGILEYDPSTGDVTSLARGVMPDSFVRCVMVLDGIVYSGSQWGLERFDLETRRWLPMVHAPQGAASDVAATIAIEAPEDGTVFAPGSSASVHGIATLPADARVEVRVGAGAWTMAQGGAQWSATLALAHEGATSIVARVVGPTGSLAQDAVSIDVRAPDRTVPDAEATRASVQHTPVLSVFRGETATFKAWVADTEEATGVVYLTSPDGERTELPMTRGPDGTLNVTGPALESVGVASYWISISKDTGAVRLPEPFSAQGSEYRFHVVERGGLAAAMILADSGVIHAKPGTRAVVELVIQNTGTRAAPIDLTFDGAAAAWVADGPRVGDVPAGQSRKVALRVDVPADVGVGAYALNVTATPQGSSRVSYVAHFSIEVSKTGQPAAEAADEAGGVPAPAVFGALAALASAAAAARFRRRGPVC